MYDDDDYIDEYPDIDEVLDDEDPFSDFVDIPPIDNDDINDKKKEDEKSLDNK